ncbi:transporter substrate-binding domain-containing diguanylate cyclase [Sulfurimonas sp.]
MKYIVLIIITYLLLASSLMSHEMELTQKEKLWLKKHPVIKVSNEDDWAPFDFSVGGKARGYSVDIINHLAKKIGIKVQFINGYSWSELLEQFENKNIDLMHVMAKNKQREKKYIFSHPYMPYRTSYIIRDDEKNINSHLDFDGKKIAVGKDWYSTKIIKKMYPKANVIEYKNSTKILEALSTSKVDVAMDNIIVAKYLMGENLITNIKHGGYIELDGKTENNLYFVSHKDNPELISIFNKAYESLNTEDKLNLQKKWFTNSDTNSISIELSNKEKKYLKKKKTITMCIDPDWMPFEKFDKNGNHTGMTADYFEVFQKDIGVEIKVINTKTWSESIEAAKDRRCDILSLAMETTDRKKYMNFTTPYLSIPLVMATKQNVSFFDDFKYLKNEKVGIVKGYAFNEIIRREYPNIKVVNVDNLKDGLQKVANGELFGFIDTMASIGYIFQKKFVGELKIAGKFEEKWELGIGVRNDDLELLSIFERVIKNLSPELKQTIFSKYIAIKYEKMTDYEFLTEILIVVFIFMAIGVYHNRKLSLVNKQLENLQEKLQEQANRDPMTNLYNRRYFHDVANDITHIAKRKETDTGIIMIDIDNFKSINDKYGHSIGDSVIKQLGLLLIEHTRESDIVARFGGEEFVVLLPNTDIDGSMHIASILREVVQKESIYIDENNFLKYTVSLGVDNMLHEDKDIEKTLNRADEALYAAKNSGKNKVVRYSEII